MFGFLKKKFSNVIDSLTKKKEDEEKFEESIEKIEEKIEKEPEKVAEEIKEIAKEEKPVIKEYIEQELKQIQEEVKDQPKEEKVSLFKKVIKKITEKKLSEEDVNPILDELGDGLIEGDVAYEVAEKIKNDLKVSLLTLEIKRSGVKDVIVSRLKNSLMEILNVREIDIIQEAEKKTDGPYKILFLGYNGSGKTTTLAKVANWLKNNNGLQFIAAGSDTFRAGSIEQLEEHAAKINAKGSVVRHYYGSDPAAVAFDAVAHAKAKGIKFVLIDTAGRVHTNENLMAELEKIKRVNQPDLKVLVIDSMTGNDAVLQARMFNQLGIDAVIFTKVDVNEKGGAILSVTHELKKPILFLCNGQGYENMIKFNAKEFVDNLVGG